MPKGERKWTVRYELSISGSGIRTCILRMQNLGVRNALHCSAKGFFESFYNEVKKETSTVWYLSLFCKEDTKKMLFQIGYEDLN